MKLTLAIEWFLNPDHLPFIVAQRQGIFERCGIDFELIEPDGHYDGLAEVLEGNIAFAINEPLHLIEQFDERLLDLGRFFETRGGVLLKPLSYDRALRGETLRVTTPVSNPLTDTIGYEILRRYYAARGVDLGREQVVFVPNGFEHLRHLREGADAAWLYFDNFEGVEARAEGLEVLYLDAQHAGFANFSALDIFVGKDFYANNAAVCERFLGALKTAIEATRRDPSRAMADYYAYTRTEPSPLSDAILEATMGCFDPDFSSDHAATLPILGFFREIGITALEPQRLKSAFLR